MTIIALYIIAAAMCISMHVSHVTHPLGYHAGPSPTAAAPAAAIAEETTPEPSEEADNPSPAGTPAKVQLKAWPAPRYPVRNWATYTAVVDDTAQGTVIPDAFLGTSHEWNRIPDWAANLPAFANIFSQMGPSPILRIGGATQDALDKVPGKDVWDTLAALHKATGCRYLIGLPLWTANAIEVGKGMMEIATATLGNALVGFELGNEPEFWPTGYGGHVGPNGAFVNGFDEYAAWFHKVATALNPCTADGPVPLLAGPGWGNVNTIDASWLQRILNKGRCYLRESSIHYYPYVDNTTVDATGLLAQDLQEFGLDKFRWLDSVARAKGLATRVSETNSLYGGGRAGLSDTFVGALWNVDALLAFANAGASGFHFHWGYGGSPDGGGQPNVGVQTNFYADGKPWPSVHAPWFGYLLYVAATAGNHKKQADTTMLNITTNQGSCTANMKTYALLTNSGSMRIVVLNKADKKDCNAAIQVSPKFCTRAILSRMMPGYTGMLSKGEGVTWRGQNYYMNEDGRLGGNVTTYVVKPTRMAGAKSGPCLFSFSMPGPSGALLEIQAPATPQ